MVKYKHLLFIGLAALFLDQLTKQLIKIFSINTGNHFIDISYTTNTGSLFSLFANNTYSNLVFILLSLVALGLMYYLFKEENSKLRKISYTLISAGIIGNFIDRLIFGFVIDWINFHFFPIFNLADSFLVVGVVISIVSLIRKE